MQPEHLHPGGYTPSVEVLFWFGYLSFPEPHLPRANGSHSGNMGVRQGRCVVLTHEQ